jgi:hypothetical protein
VETVVVKVLGAAGSGGRGAAFGRVGSGTRDVEGAEKPVGGGCKPGSVARLKSNEILDGCDGWMKLPEGGEEVVGERLVEG